MSVVACLHVRTIDMMLADIQNAIRKRFAIAVARVYVYVTYPESDLDTHARQRPRCEIAPPKYEEKIDRDQMNAIKRRTMGTDPLDEWFRIYAILFPGSRLPPVAYAYADGDASVAVQEYLAYFQAEAPSLLLELVRSQTVGHIPLSIEHQNILNEAFEYAAAQVISRLRPRSDRSQPSRAAMQNVEERPGSSSRPSNLAQSAMSTERISPLPSADSNWSVIHADNEYWPDAGQEDWLSLELAD
jgi:hypothetical protein